MFSSVIDYYISANSVCSASNFLLRVSGVGASSFLFSVGITISSTAALLSCDFVPYDTEGRVLALLSTISLGGSYSCCLFFLFFLISITAIVIIIISISEITIVIIISRFLSFATTSTVSPS